MLRLNPTFEADGVRYRDGKRYAWLLSVIVPALLGFAPLFYAVFDSAWALWIPAILIYFGIPAMDLVLGVDCNNPPESVVGALEADPYYRYATFLLAPVLWSAFLVNAYFVATTPLPWHGYLATAVGTGLIIGAAINLGHELGHKTTKFERGLATYVLALGAYGHFSIDHNRGHHRHVATPEDCASSRMGESLYAFALRELPGAFFRAWRFESAQLRKKGLRVWSWNNEILRAGLVTGAVVASLLAAFGPILIPFLLIAYFVGAMQLTLANYIEHYGLLRQKRPNGRYERCKPHHSWNSNHIVSNWVLFHLQRHSDHHANATRRYQALRHFDDLPTLPNGYFGMYLLAVVPPLWFRVMNPRLLDAVDRDPARINFDPSKEAALRAHYELDAPRQPPHAAGAIG